MAKNNNEAKIKFTAETGQFNDEIKKSDKTMANLRAEMKLNSEQMKTNGRSVEGLEKEHSLLESQLTAARTKTEALSNKIEVATRLFGENSNEVMELKTKLTQAQAAEEKVQQSISKCNSALAAQKAAEAEANSATGKLTATIKKQQTEVDELKKEYSEAVLQYGKNSKEARSLGKQLRSLSGELADNEDKMKDAARAADKLDKSIDDAGDAARKSEGGFTVMKGAIADLVSEAVQWGISKLGEFIDYLKELPEATLEIRQDFATLETSFKSAGLSTEQATNTWKELYTIFGEDDRAVEAANLIAKMSKNQNDLNTWVTITKGVWGQYQDSLPVEGLAEASNETAKTGKVTGVLADALNWSGEAASMFSKYMSEDVTTAEDAFNEALAECTTEQERQALITETLTKLYGDSAKAYDEASGALNEEKRVAAETILIENQLAEAVAPVTTAWQGLKNELAKEFLPVIQTVAGFLSEHPGLLKGIAVAVTILGVAVGVIATAWSIYTVAQWLANTAMWACPITWIIAAIAALIAIIVALVAYWDEIAEGASRAWEGIKNAFSGIGEWFAEKFTAVKNAVSNVWNSIKNGAINVWNGIKNVFSSIGSWFSDKFAAVKNAASNAWNSIKNGAINVWNGIKNTFSNIGGWFKDKFNAVKNGITNIWNKIKLNLPKIKLPHFKIKGEFSWNPIRVPTLSVDWYKDGGIFTKPTIFNTPFGMKGVGEAGAEAVLPIDRLEGYISGAIEKSTQAVNLQVLADAIEDLANRPIEMNINGKQFALATAGDTDNVSGMRNRLVDRGMIL